MTSNMNANNLAQTVGKRLRLRRQNHSSEMITALNACLQEECFTDACLLCEERTIKVHRIILSLFSQFFKRTFQSLQSSNMCNSPVVVVIKNLPFTDLKAIVEFIYNGEVAIPRDQLNSLLKSAANLEVEGLNWDNTVNATQLPIAGTSNNKSNAFISTPLTLNLVKPVLTEKRPQKRVRTSTTSSITKPTIQVINPSSTTNVFQTDNRVFNNQTPISIVQLGPVSSAPQLSAVNNSLHKNKVNLLKNSNKQTPPKRPKISINPTVKSLSDNKNRTETVSQPNVCSTSVPSVETNTVTEPKSTTPSTSTPQPTVENSVGLTKLYELSNDRERKEFLDKLVKFSNESGNPITRCPTINKLPVDLYKLYLAVKERGGFDNVTTKQLWIECTHSCNIPSTSSAACALQIHYQKHLKPFESRFNENETHKLNTDQINKETKQNKETPDISNIKTQVINPKTHTINGTVTDTTSNERSTNQKSNEIEEIWIEDDTEVIPIIKTYSSTQKHSTPLRSSAGEKEIITVNSPPISKASTSQTQIKVATPVKTCNLCYKSFTNDALLIEHKTKEHKSITKCAVCTKEFANSALLLLHVKNDKCYEIKSHSNLYNSFK